MGPIVSEIPLPLIPFYLPGGSEIGLVLQALRFCSNVRDLSFTERYFEQITDWDKSRRGGCLRRASSTRQRRCPKIDPVRTEVSCRAKCESLLDFDFQCELKPWDRVLSIILTFLRFEVRGVKKVKVGLTALWRWSVHRDVDFYPSMLGLPIIEVQKHPIVGLFTSQQEIWDGHRPLWDNLGFFYR